MSRKLSLMALSLFVVLGITALTAQAADPQTKTGTIKSVDAKAHTFVLATTARPLTYNVDEKTVITLDGKPATFDTAIKDGQQASVTYTKSGESRVASKVEVTSTPAK